MKFITHIEHTNPLEKCLSNLAKYQYFLYFFLFLSKPIIFWHIINLIFLSPDVNYKCDGESNKCPCNKPEWDKSVFTNTMQMKFHLICDKKWLIQNGHSIAFLGCLTGAFTFGFLSDKYGRLNAFSLSSLVIAIAGVLISMMPSILLFIIFRFIEGIGVGGAIVTSYVLAVEYCSTEYRELITALFHLPLNLGHMSLPGISYVLRDMDHFQLAISIPMFTFAGLKFILKESPKWLLDNNRVDETVVILKKICPATTTIKEDLTAFLATRTDVHRVKFKQIFKYRSLTINFFCMAVNYFVCGMCYYGVSQLVSKMGGDIHTNVAISGALVFPGTIMCTVMLGMFSRRKFLMCTNSLAGIFILISIVFEQGTMARIGCACVSNCFYFMSFIIVFLYGVELFPTSVRNAVLGNLSVISRIGQTLVPQINAVSPQFAAIVFGGTAILGAILCLPLPETKNMELPSSLEDTDRINQNK